MNLEDKDIYGDSDTSDDIENLEDVKKLKVKSSEPKKGTGIVLKSPTVEKEEKDDGPMKEVDDSLKELDVEDSMREAESIRTEEEKDDDDLSPRDRDESITFDEDEIKKEERRREKMKLLLSGYLELKTKKEIEKALLNEKKIVAQWLYPFRGTYQKEWELEMKKLKLGFQKTLDFKKSHIQAIQQERKLIELNHLWADSAHYRISEELFDFLRMRCEKLKERYLEQLEETKKFYLEREKEIVAKCSKAEDRAKALAHMRKSIHDKTIQQTKETLDKFKHEGEYLKQKEIELIKQKHLTYIEMIAQELQTSISPPEHKIEEVRALFLEWKEKYESFLQVSEKSRKRLELYKRELPQLEARVADAKEKLKNVQEENKLSKHEAMAKVISLQKASKKYEGLDPSLRKMISESEEIVGQLRERKSKLDKIVKLKNACDKLETENDAMIPSVTFLEPSDMEQLKEQNCLPLIKDLCSGEVVDHNLLKNLYHKLSKIKLQNQYLVHNIDNLKIENKSLRSDMKKFLHLISSGEWSKAVTDDFVTLYEMSGKFEDGITSYPHSNLDKKVSVEDNLKLLNKKYQPLTQEIIQRTDRME